MKKPHANSHQNQADHHLYEIRDKQTNDTDKYGICGDPLLPDGSSPRANRQLRVFNRIAGWKRFFTIILLMGIPGRKRAEEIEDEYIEAYRQKHGQKPPGNQ